MKQITDKGFIVLLITAMIIWGGGWVSGKLIAGQISTNLLAFWRFVISFLFLLPFMLNKKELLKISLPSLLWTALAAVFYVIYNQMFLVGVEQGLAHKGGIIVTTLNPMFTFLLFFLIKRKKPRWKETAGFVLGLTAGLILIEFWHLDWHQLVKNGNIYFLLGALAWSFLTLTSQQTQKKTTFFTYSFYVFILAALFEIPFIAGQDVFIIFSKGTTFWVNLLFISLGAMAIASTIYFWAAGRLGSDRASSFIFLVPVSAVLGSWIFLGEIPSIITLIGGSLALAAVYMINSKVKKN